MRLTRPVANFGVVDHRARAGLPGRAAGRRGRRREPADGLRGAAAQPQPLRRRVRRARARRRRRPPARPGLYHVVFDSPTTARARALPLPLLDRRRASRRARARRAARFARASRSASASRDAGSGIDVRLARGDVRRPQATARGSWARASGSPRDGLAPGRHRLRSQLSDYQETRNNENVAAHPAEHARRLRARSPSDA